MVTLQEIKSRPPVVTKEQLEKDLSFIKGSKNTLVRSAIGKTILIPVHKNRYPKKKSSKSQWYRAWRKIAEDNWMFEGVRHC